jgi:hypothetical protein
MPPSQHALLSPSSAERWLQCPASVLATKDLPKQSDSPYAHEGTVAHSLAELKASVHFGKITQGQFLARRSNWRRTNAELLDRDEVEVEMERHTDAYVDLLDQRMARHHDSEIMFEQRLDSGVPGCWGTSDAVIVSPKHVEIVDFKYGQGVTVAAKGNPQLRLYALGALDTYGDILGETETVYITIHQPRLDHVLTDDMTPAALRAWREEITPTAEEALAPGAHFGPSETACHWCPLSGRCRAQLEAIFSTPYTDPVQMTPEEIADALDRIGEIRNWLHALDEAALTMAYSEGVRIPRYKVVLSGGRRSVDELGAMKALTEEHGYSFDEIGKMKLRGIGELENLMGKDKFAELLAPHITPATGSPALVPEADRRPSITPDTEAQKEFLL